MLYCVKKINLFQKRYVLSFYLLIAEGKGSVRIGVGIGVGVVGGVEWVWEVCGGKQPHLLTGTKFGCA